MWWIWKDLSYTESIPSPLDKARVLQDRDSSYRSARDFETNRRDFPPRQDLFYLLEDTRLFSEVLCYKSYFWKGSVSVHIHIFLFVQWHLKLRKPPWCLKGIGDVLGMALYSLQNCQGVTSLLAHNHPSRTFDHLLHDPSRHCHHCSGWMSLDSVSQASADTRAPFCPGQWGPATGPGHRVPAPEAHDTLQMADDRTWPGVNTVWHHPLSRALGSNLLSLVILPGFCVTFLFWVHAAICSMQLMLRCRFQLMSLVCLGLAAPWYLCMSCRPPPLSSAESH